MRTLILSCCLLACTPVFSAETKSKANVLFILVDDLGCMDIGANNPGSFYETPNIDSLARRGMRFTSGYAACPVCSPTRASLMTGRYPQRVGVTDYIGAAQPERWKRDTRLLPAGYSMKLGLEETTMAEAFRQEGYKTFFAGKWHLGPKGFWPGDQGFEINKGGCGAGMPKSYFSPYGNPMLEDGPAGEHLPDRLADETARFIEANRDRPFFAYLSFYSVHVPLVTRPELQRKYEEKARNLKIDARWGREGANEVRLVQENAIYAGMMESLDQAIGKVLSKLEELKLTDRTIVVFTSDNGGLSTAEGHPTSNLPFRAGKGWLYEGGTRVPMIIAAPGRVHPGVSDTPVTSPDLFPTLLELAGLPLQPRAHVDGRSILPILRGGALPERPVFWHYPHYGNQGGSPGSAMRKGEWKLIQWFEGDRIELFNLKNDPGEKTNLASGEPSRVREMQRELDAWRKEVGARMPAPNPAWTKRP